MSEPKPCPACHAVAGNDCGVCDGTGFEPYSPPERVLPGGRLFDPAIIPDVEPPALPKQK